MPSWRPQSISGQERAEVVEQCLAALANVDLAPRP